MRILFTGATGVLGSAAVPRLIEAGHELDAVYRTEEGRGALASIGARPVSVDLLDAGAVKAATVEADAVIHYATAIPPMAKMRSRDAWAMNDRLRVQATANLVAAAGANDIEVFVQQSVTFAYADGGDRRLTEDSPVDPPSPVVVSALEAERLVAEHTRRGGRGIVLRLSRLYGPGRASDETVEAVARRAVPVIGRGENYVSSLHVADAASATVSALAVPAGVYNVSDDEPVTSLEYVTSLAAALDAPRPRHVPAWLARPAAGVMLPMLTVSHRVANDRFKRAAAWEPQFRSVTDGWRGVVDAAS